MDEIVRAAAAQFHIGDDLPANLATCLRMIRAAGEHRPQLLVLPEFSNHCSWYLGPDHCREVSVELGGGFLGRGGRGPPAKSRPGALSQCFPGRQDSG